MFCYNCGEKLSDDAKFCTKCGKKVRKENIVETSDKTVPHESHVVQKNNEENSQEAIQQDIKQQEVIQQDVMQQEVVQQEGIKTSKKRLPIIVGAGVLGLFLVIGGILGIKYVSSTEKLSEEAVATDEKKTEAEAAAKKETTKLIFDTERYEVAVGEKIELYALLKSPNIQQDQLTWESSDPSVVIDGAGCLTLEQPNMEVTITVKDKKTGDQLGSCIIYSLSEIECLIKQIQALNDGTAQMEEIHLYEENYLPAERNKQFKWDQTLFYTLEDINPDSAEDGMINGYDLEKKQLINGDTKAKIEYEIYRNPTSGKVNKIVSIEDKGDYLEITEYYYTDDGKVSFIFAKQDINYIPSYATPNVSGERYYFCQDVMVKWRTVADGKQVNYVVGDQEKNRGGNAGQVITFDELSTEKQSYYDAKEKKMINAAYNTYNFVLSAKGTSEIVGYVNDQYGNAMSGAKVQLFIEGEEPMVYQCTTGTDGLYSIMVPSGGHNYRILVSKDGYVETTLYQISLNTQLVGVYQETVYLVPQMTGQTYNIRLALCDAFNSYGDGMMPLGGAMINVRKGINNKSGEIYLSSQADSYGEVGMNLEPGSYTVEISKAGYIVSYYTIVARQNDDFIQMNTSPILNDDEVRIVLTWGSIPSDLDSHLFTPYSSVSEDTTYHIWYGNTHDANGNNLDVDDTTSYGPETMTINHIGNGLYKYYVADYTNCSANNTQSYDMSLSGARVSVYTKDGLVQTFYVPSNRPGVIWEVFEIRNKRIIPLQRYYYNIAEKTWWNNEK